MRAAVLFEANEPLRILDGIAMPALCRGQVRVKMLYSGVCHSQLMEVEGKRGPDKYLPHLLGHEGVGVVEEIGDGVTKVAVGDKVILGWIKGEGLDAPGAKYHYQDMILNSGSVTTFSTQTIVAENRLVILPDGFPLKLAVLLGCALPTGLGLVLNELQPEQNATFAIYGLGGIGMSALMAATLFSPRMLIAVDVEREKLSLACRLGATHAINPLEKDPVAEIQRLTAKNGVDYALEAAGTVKSIEQAFESIRDGGGQLVFASHPPEGEKIRLEPYAFHRGKMIRGSWGGGSKPDRDIPRFVDLFNKNQLPLDALISEEYALDEINNALQDLKARKIVRALIRM